MKSQCYVLIISQYQSKLEQAIADWANMYSDTPYAQRIQLYRKKGDPTRFLVLFTNQPDLDRFSYFVNYMEYPIGLEQFLFKVLGFFPTKSIEDKHGLKTGEWIMVYVNHDDPRGDNVYFTEDHGANHVFDFGGKLKELDKSIREYRTNLYNIQEYHHIIDIFPSKAPETMENRSWWKFW